MNIGSIVSGILSPLASLGKSYIDRKKAKDSLQAKAKMAKGQQETNVTLTDAEWEVVNSSKMDTSWKDEWVTIVITAPIPGVLVGALWSAISGDQRVLQGFTDGINALNAIGVPMGTLMTAVTLAAVGLKIWRA